VAFVLKSPDPASLPDPVPQPPDGYLDAVAGQPLLPAARRAWMAAMEQAWTDPARLHHYGRRAGIVLDAARASIASGLGIRPNEVFFTSSGPTAVQVAVAGLLQTRSRVSRRVVASAVESLAVLDPAQRLGDVVDLVAVDHDGRLDVDRLSAALSSPAALVAVQAANAEVGTRQPLAEAADIARGRGVPLLVHAIQVIGRDPIPTDWDVLAASARDWGGPAGVGVLAVRSHVRWAPDQNPDRGWVGGYPDIPGAAGAAAALEYLLPHAAEESMRLSGLVGRLRAALPASVDRLEVAGADTDRLPHIVSFSVGRVTGEALVSELDRRGLAVASGSACTSDTRMASHVLVAMGLAVDASVRVSLPLGCSSDTVERFLAELPAAVATVRGLVP
jgi:cysteine desulfurase